MYFAGAHVRRYAIFDEARFSDLASFAGCEFEQDSSFRRAEFRGEVTFMNAQFDHEPSFGEAKVLADNESTALRVWPPGVDTVEAPRQPGDTWLRLTRDEP